MISGAVRAVRAAGACASRRSKSRARRPSARTMTDRKYTREEVSKLDSKAQNYFIIDNVVYDVSQFLDEHPGGHEVLVNAAGSDVSEDFADVGHSYDAKELMKKFVVGELVEADRIELVKRQVQWDDTKPDNDASFVNSWKFPVLLGIVVTLLYTYLFG